MSSYQPQQLSSDQKEAEAYQQAFSMMNTPNISPTSSDDYLFANQNTQSQLSCSSLISRKTKSYLSVLGAILIYFGIGLYLSAGNTGVYLSSYLIHRSNSTMQVSDSIWFLSFGGFSALFLPLGGLLESYAGVRMVVVIGGSLESLGLLASYWAIDTTFLLTVLSYGGAFFISLATTYTPPLMNLCKWHPKRMGLVSGIASASMAVAPILYTPLITYLVNPQNKKPDADGLFSDPDILDRTKWSTLVQACMSLSLFYLGALLTFPAPDDDDDIEKIDASKLPQIKQVEDKNFQSTTIQAEDPLKIENNEQTTKVSIEPKFAFKTSEFWLMSSKVLITEYIFIYLLFVYKPYGLTFITNDYFLSTVGATCAFSNTIGRLLLGYFKDKLGYRKTSIPLSIVNFLFVLSFPLARKVQSPIWYATCVVLAVGASGSQYALIPSAVQDSFGPKYATMNIGFVYMSTVLGTLGSALLSQNLTNLIGWDNMVSLMAVLSFIDIVNTLFMPADPHKRLLRRYREFYKCVDTETKTNQEENYGKVFENLGFNQVAKAG